jgi:REP element-mobilizing transposase RayT
MSEKYKFRDPDGLYFVTLTVVHWIDLFTRPDYKHVIIESLGHCRTEKGLVIHAWCLMPSHLHMIVSTNKEPLADIMRDFKKFTSKKVVKTIQRINESRSEWLMRGFADAGKDLKRIAGYKVWQDGNQPKGIETNAFLEQKLDYIHRNPVEAEIVDEPEYYWYSSARDYAGRKGLLKVEMLW